VVFLFQLRQRRGGGPIINTGVVVKPKADKKKVWGLVGGGVGDRKNKGTDHPAKGDPNARHSVSLIQTPELGLVSFL
jgi:hypothetical protein